MLRLIHNQTISGSILVNDIDDGLPNKSARRGLVRAKVNGSPVLVAGGIASPANYRRDGNTAGRDSSTLPEVNYPKQKCYIPLWSILPGGVHSTTIPGYIDLNTSDRVLLSQDHGVIAGLVKAGLITVNATLDPTTTVAPVITSAIVAVSPEALTITGTTFTSISPDVSSVKIGSTTLSYAAIYAVGTFTATSIVIPASLLTGLITVGTTNVTVNANSKSATALITSAAPTITTAVVVVSTGILTLTGTHFTSLLPDLTSVTVGSTVIPAASFTTLTDTSIVIPQAALPTIAVGTTTVSVTADSVTSTAVLITSAAPTITSATVAAGGAYTMAIVGTHFVSLSPDVSSVTIGSTTLTSTQIGGTFTDTSITVPEALIPLSMVVGTTTVTVTADGMTTAAHAIAVTNTTPTLATAVLSPDLTLTGTGLRSILPNLTSVTVTGTGAVVLTAAQILGVSGGSISDTTIVIKASLIPGVVTTNSHVAVTANSLTSTPVVDVS